MLEHSNTSTRKCFPNMFNKYMTKRRSRMRDEDLVKCEEDHCKFQCAELAKSLIKDFGTYSFDAECKNVIVPKKARNVCRGICPNTGREISHLEVELGCKLFSIYKGVHVIVPNSDERYTDIPGCDSFLMSVCKFVDIAWGIQKLLLNPIIEKYGPCETPPGIIAYKNVCQDSFMFIDRDASAEPVHPQHGYSLNV